MVGVVLFSVEMDIRQELRRWLMKFGLVHFKGGGGMGGWVGGLPLRRHSDH